MKNNKWMIICLCMVLVAAIITAVVLLTRPQETKEPAEEATAPETAETAAAPGAEATGDTLAAIRERGSLVIAMEGAWQPWTYHDEAGALTGFDVEISALQSSNSFAGILRMECMTMDSILSFPLNRSSFRYSIPSEISG